MSLQYKFSWPAGPGSVVITGAFDEWKGTLPLVKQSDGDFEITMPVSFKDEDDSKFYFKFIVDEKWVTSDKYAKELDVEKKVENNYIVKSDVVNAATAQGAAIPEAGALVAGASEQTASANKKKNKKKKNKKKNKKKKNAAAATAAVAAEGEAAGETEETSDDVTEASKSATPATELEVENESENIVNILPVIETQAATTVAGEMGPVIVENPEEIKEFREISDVDANELNERLNKENAKAIEEPVVEEAVAEEPKVEEPVVEEPVIEQPNVEEPVVEEPVVEEPVAEEPVVEEPVAEEPKVEEPVVEEQTKEGATLDPKAQTESVAKETEKKEKTKPVESVKKITKQVESAKPTEAEKPKKKGFFSKLKKLFG
ncbi:hypothetical protein TPHA_0F02300 [Tetrapisispora phaffii CBS 4417]|uniref:AMP-activated protein kinase glycogen-binding domain-containing protein n=1 Tax=Tetrapisispora phaffii (strain ATCC 24235 / CBS 4417 / NBRC 1672 / NRRL Y-8282 / UCD 70-5) TaxID=1071381 RepID=G8BUC5_TETPH|nr:hypothetical protein TPHA_0F02300 [Tetrapisispora phaffii CBS 4417]CCE63711.1 hypothetical protein TPHA_0F02300 [Tetrapisispora phaffii CBS 4417]